MREDLTNGGRVPENLTHGGRGRENLTGRLGRWCARHPWRVLAAWVVLAGAGVLATGPLFGRLADSGIPRDLESMVAYRVISAGDDSAGTVIGVVDGIDPAAPQVRQAVLDTGARIAALPGVRAVAPTAETGASAGSGPGAVDPPDGAGFPVSSDGQALLIRVTLDALERPERDAAVQEISTLLHGLTADLPPGAVVEVGGDAALSMQNRAAVQADLARAEYISLPLTLVVLVLVFGGLVAATLPVLTAVVSVATAMALMLGFSYVTDVHSDGITVVTLLGLGLSIDYALLLVARYREELGRVGQDDLGQAGSGGDEAAARLAREAAVGRAWATAGRTVFFSALTVAAALTGLLMFRLPALTALGAAGVSVAVVCLFASLTFTAALVGLLHRRIKPARRTARNRSAEPQGLFARLARAVQRRPWLVATSTMIALLLAGAPLATGELRLPGLDGIPRSVEAARVADTLAERFGRPPAPAITVAATTDPATLDAWAARWAGDPAIARVNPAKALAGDDGIATVTFEAAGEPQGGAVRALVDRMRADRPPGGASWVTGDAAALNDLMDLLWSTLLLALLVTGAAMFVLLFLMTGSLVVPVKAILANLVSLGATFGVLMAVFRYGVGAEVLDTLTVGSLNPFIVVTVFAFAFGLSMDYEIFLLGRIKEYVDAGVPTDVAVRHGLQRTGRVITSAALLMIIVFSAFAAARMGMVEQIGLGLAVAVLIDATVVRCLLVPATMTLLGRWNWWAPAWLRRVHARFGLRESAPQATPAHAGVGAGAGQSP